MNYINTVSSCAHRSLCISGDASPRQAGRCSTDYTDDADDGACSEISVGNSKMNPMGLRFAAEAAHSSQQNSAEYTCYRDSRLTLPHNVACYNHSLRKQPTFVALSCSVACCQSVMAVKPTNMQEIAAMIAISVRVGMSLCNPNRLRLRTA